MVTIFEIKIAILAIICVSIGYLIDGDNGIFIAGAILILAIIVAIIGLILDTILPTGKKGVLLEPPDEECVNVTLLCSKYAVDRKPFLITVAGRDVAKLYRGNELTLGLPAGACELTISHDGKSEVANFIVHENLKIHVWSEPHASRSIKITEIGSDASSLDADAHSAQRRIIKTMCYFAVPLFVFGSVAIVCLLWKAGAI